jgi:hypothetical protein
LYYYPKIKPNMFVVARKITRDGFSVFDVRLGAVVPAWSAGTQVHMDVSGGVPAGLDASSPCRHDGCGAVIASCICQPTGENLFPSEVRGKACITMLQDLRATRKSYDRTKHLRLGDSSRQGAKSAKFG